MASGLVVLLSALLLPHTINGNDTPSNSLSDDHCYHIANRGRYLNSSSAVDPNYDYLRFAVLSEGCGEETVWKFLPTNESCFLLCNVHTGLYLMAPGNDRVYTVERAKMSGDTPEGGHIFGPYYPFWPTNQLALIVTNTLDQSYLCSSPAEEPRLVVTSPSTPGVPQQSECYWDITAANCPPTAHC